MKSKVKPLSAEMKYKELIDTKSKLKRLCRKMSEIEEFAFDTETNSLRAYGENSDFSCVGISISWGDYDNYYIPLGHLRPEDYDRNVPIRLLQKYLKPIFEREDITIVGQNIKFDMHVMSRIGIYIKTKNLFDTMIASWICDENTPNGLKENTSMIFGISQTHFKEVTELVPASVKKEFGYKANSKVPFSLVLIDDALKYAIDDAYYTWNGYLYWLDKIEEEDMVKQYYKSYVPFIHTLYNMEERGVSVDLEALKKMDVDMKNDLDSLEYQMYELVGLKFNAGSSQQLAELLFGYEKPPKVDNKTGKKVPANVNYELIKAGYNFKVIDSTKSGAPSTSGDVIFKLSKLEYKRDKHKQKGVQLCKLLLEYKKLSKLYSAFVTGLQEQLYDDGKLHPTYNIIGTDSGRISCSNPNLQQLPKANEEDKYQIRSVFVGSEYLADSEGKFLCEMPDKDNFLKKHPDIDYQIRRKKIVALDFCNLEMRVLAHFSKDDNLLRMFANNEDTHGSTAVNMFELDCKPEEVKKLHPHLRQAAKIINFLLMYGGSAPTLYDNLKSDWYSPIDLGGKEYLEKYHCKNGVEVAQIYIDKYFKSYSGVAKFIKDQKKYAHRNGFVYTLLKRKRRLPDINSNDYKKMSYCERLSVNSCIQGSAADLTMNAQNRIDKDQWYVDHNVLMLLQVHDEVVFECPEEYVEECIEKTKHYMSHPFGDNVELNLPMEADADFGDSYQEAK